MVSLLNGLKKYTSNITAIITVTENFSDIKKYIAALSSNEVEMDALLNYTFNDGKLRDLNFGDIYLASMAEVYKNISESVSNTNKVLNMSGKILPATLDKMKICAELDDGTTVETEAQMKNVLINKVTKIKRVYVSPTNCRMTDGIASAISKADAIVIGPGSLYHDIIPNFLIKNFSKTIKDAKAMKIYVSNIMTEPGATESYSLSEHIDALLEHAGGNVMDYCICDTGEIVPEFIRTYNKQGAEIIEKDFAKVKQRDINIIQENMSLIKGEYIRHNPDTLASTIIKLMCDDQKYRNKHNEMKYLVSKSILRDEKKRLRKIAKKKGKKSEDKHKYDKSKSKSKFNEKYKQRIHAIKNSDEKRKDNLKNLEKSQKFDK